jgi:hypothetical protein
MVTPRAADVTALSVTGQIPGSHHGWNPPPAWRARPVRCTNGRANTPRQFGHAEECESEWSMDWVTRRNTRHVGGSGGVLCTSKSVSWCPFHQGRSGAALGCKRNENVNFLRIYGILGEPGGRGGWSRAPPNQVTAGSAIIIIVMTPRRSIAALIAYRYCTRFSREQKA